jgi:glycosyltransferase involved in cell wall biosynthesis
MKILIASIIDVKKAAPNRLHHFIKYLSKNHDITVICLNDSWKAKQVNTESQYKDFHEIISNIRVRYITENPISPIRQEIFSPIYIKNIKELHGEKFDVIFNYNTLVLGYFLAKKLNVPLVYDIADDLPAMIGDSPQIPACFRGIGKWIGKIMVNRSIHQAACVCATSDIFRKDYSIPQDKFQILPNGVDTSIFKKVTSSVRKDLGVESDYILGYVGVLREWVDLTPVYQALKKLDATKLLVVGQEGLYQENREMVKNLGIADKVIFTGNVPYADVPKYIAAMDICLIPFKDNDISHNAVPLKLFEYMACEKQVISTNLEGVKESVRDRILYCDKSDEYYSTILKLKKEGSPMNSLQDNRKYIEEHFEWRSMGMSVERILMGAV